MNVYGKSEGIMVRRFEFEHKNDQIDAGTVGMVNLCRKMVGQSIMRVPT